MKDALAIIGASFLMLLTTGLVMNGKQCAIALDQWVGTCLRKGHMADETISAAAHRNGWKRTERFINWLFHDPMHCAKAYIAEMDGTQNDPIYHKE